MRVILIIALFLTVACDKKVKVAKNRGLINISEIDSYIHDIAITPWKVGKNKEAEISMGFSFKIDVPKFSKADQAVLAETYPIDSWAFKVTHTYQGRKKELGYMYLPFGRTIKTTDNFTLYIYYHAAVVSERFRRFACPAFGHRKEIVDYEVVKSEPGKALYVRPNRNLKIKYFALDHLPVTFSGGLNLTGVYEVELALYSHSDSKLYSEFVPMGNKVVISNENEVKVNSCIGIREETYPLPSSREPRIEDIQIK